MTRICLAILFACGLSACETTASLYIEAEPKTHNSNYTPKGVAKLEVKYVPRDLVGSGRKEAKP